MTKPNVISIDGINYVREDSMQQQTTGEIRIVILNRGWNIVGYFSQEGDTCTIKKAAVIRRWGTTQGLGEIAFEGPKSQTILDKCPDVSFHVLGMVASINCVGEKWENKL